MKKIILLLGLLLSNNASFADCEYKCVEPYDMNNKFMSVLSNVSGANFTSELIAKAIIRKEFSKIAKADKLKVDLDSYSAKDLKNGIFKSMSVKGNDVNADGIHFSTLEMKTLCNFNYVQQKGKDVIFKEDFPMLISASMNEKDINETMKSEKYKKVVDDLNKLGFGGIKITSTDVEIKSNKFYYNVGVSIPFIRGEKKISIGADLKVKNGKIDFENTKLLTKSLNIDLSKIDFILNYLNPLDFSVKVLDNKYAKFSIKNINISDNIIKTDAVAIIPKD